MPRFHFFDDIITGRMLMPRGHHPRAGFRREHPNGTPERMTFNIPPSWPVLVLDDCEERIAWFRQRIPHATLVSRAEDALKELEVRPFKVIFLDHDLHWMHATDASIVKGTGKEVALAVAKVSFEGIVVIHSKNEDGARVMARHLPQAKLVRFGEFEIVPSN